MTKGEIVQDLIAKFPKAGALTLARMAYKAHPKFWSGIEACRSSVRLYLGANGKAHRKYRPAIRPLRKSGDASFPEGRRELGNWGAVRIAGPARVLVLSDVHVPYHDAEALKLAVEYGIERRADMVLLNGDLADFFTLSFWEKNPEERDFPGEVEKVREVLRELRRLFPRKRIIFKHGNHEERFDRYMRVKAPELLGIADFTMEKLFGLEALGIESVSRKRPIRLGDLNVIHGHEYRFAISNPVNPARGLFLRAKAFAMCGHFHQSSYHTEKTVEQKVIATWSTGCLCDLHPEYAVMNNWCHGFAFVDLAASGKFNVENRVIRNGKVY